MNIRLILIALLAATTLAACGDGHDHEQGSEHSGAPESALGNHAAGNETEAFYGDEAPVIIDAVPQDDHGHDHGEEDAHAPDDHDHGESSEPHAH